ncbi:MAG: hypothetical protein C4555_05180 [Dehalococcoidia bacterium]|nr:MAG: hypothetical protein C4555_05180 [Dehalococcoidia bacterium]
MTDFNDLARTLIVPDRASIATLAIRNTRFVTADGTPWKVGTVAGPEAIQDLSGTYFEIDVAATSQLNLKAFFRSGDPDYTLAFQRIAALSLTNVHVFIPAGTYDISGLITFQDKHVRIEGAGTGATKLNFTASAAKIRFFDSVNTFIPKRLHVSDLEIIKGHDTTAGNGGIAIEAQWSYTGVVGAELHATFENILIAGPASNRFWDVGIKTIDGGGLVFNNVRIDNVSTNVMNSRAGIEIVRSAASNIIDFYMSKVWVHVVEAGVRFTHAAAGNGTIEGWYANLCEFVSVRYQYLDDNTVSSNHQINGMHISQCHAAPSKSIMQLGWVSNLYVSDCNYTCGTFNDPTPLLVAGIEILLSAQVIGVVNNRLFNNTADTPACIKLPNDASVSRVIIDDNHFDGPWSACVAQPATAGGWTNIEVFFTSSNQRGTSTPPIPVWIPNSVAESRSGFGLLEGRVLAKITTAFGHTGSTAETSLASITVPAGAMGPNGSIRITVLISANDGTDTRTYRLRMGGMSGTIYRAISMGANLTLRDQCEITNRNSVASQIGFATGSGGGFGGSTAAAVTSTVNTNASFTIEITGELSNAADTITREYILVELFYGA